MERAASTMADIASAGILNAEQSDKFIDYVYDESVLKNIARLERVTATERTIEKIGVGNRVAYPKAEAADPQIRRMINSSKVTLNPVEIIVPFEVGDRLKRYNIEGDSIEDHIVKMMATQLANNLDQLWLDGNTVGAARLEGDIFDDGSTTLYVKDKYLALFNGFLKQAESGNVVDAANAALSGTVFNKAILAMPTKYRRNRNALRFMVSPDHGQGYREVMSQRATAVGDTASLSDVNLTPFGIPMVEVPLLERNPLYVENSVANTDGTTATSLTYKPIDNLVLAPTTLNENPTAKYILSTDYSESETNGTWTRLGAGSIGSGATVKATYDTRGKMILTDPSNLILAIQKDGIRVESDRNIYKGVDEYAITVSVDCVIENTDAIVLVKNIKDPTL